MPTKRTIVVTALVALLLAASGCSALQGGTGPGKEIASQTQAAMQDVDSYNFELSMTMTSQQNDQSIDITANGAIDLAEKRMRMQMGLMGRSTTQYIVDDTQYIKVGGTWQKRSVADRNIWNRQQLSRQQQLLENASVTLEGNTTIDGQDVYELSVDVNEQQVMDVIQQQQGQDLASQVDLQEVSYTMYVTHGDFHLKRIDADMKMSAQGQTLDATMEMTFSNYNGDIAIELPPEAENAVSMG